MDHNDALGRSRCDVDVVDSYSVFADDLEPGRFFHVFGGHFAKPHDHAFGFVQVAAIVLGPYGFARLPRHAKFAMLAQQIHAGGCNEFGQENDWFHISLKPVRGPYGSIHVSNSVDLQKRSFAAERSGREA